MATAKLHTLDQDVRDVLARASVADSVLTLPDQLDRPLYVKVDKALRAIGGKWNRKAGGHVFPFDPTELVSGGVAGGSVVDRKQTLQFFETPTALAQRMVELADPRPGDLVLEPSAGHGRIVREIPTDVSVVAVEVDPVNVSVLRESETPNVAIVEADFLEWAAAEAKPVFSKVLMNPPFTGFQDVAHIRAAYELLERGGTLVAICSQSPFFRDSKAAVEFRDWLDGCCVRNEQLEDDAFRESGAGVRARLIVLRA